MSCPRSSLYKLAYHPEQSLARFLATNAVEEPRTGSSCRKLPILLAVFLFKERQIQDTRCSLNKPFF